MTELADLQAVEIEINSACNRACSYCPNSVAERKTKGLMSEELYKLILNQLKEISFSGRISHNFYNEPTLHPRLEHFVKLTKEILPSCKILMYSNGTMLNKAKLDELFAAGVDRMVITKHEQDVNSDHYLFDAAFSELSPENRAKIRYQTHEQIKLVNRGGLLKHLGEKGLDLLPCFIPTHMLNITVDGRVLSCFEDFNENLIFGDLKTEKLVDIWSKDSYKQFRENLRRGLRHLHTPCKDCNRTEVLPPFDT